MKKRLKEPLLIQTRKGRDPTGVTQLATQAELIGGRTKIRSLQNTLLGRGEKL